MDSKEAPEPSSVSTCEVIESPIVFVVDGEGDVETLRSCGFVATCEATCANVAWLPEFTEALLCAYVSNLLAILIGLHKGFADLCVAPTFQLVKRYRSGLWSRFLLGLESRSGPGSIRDA